MNEIVHVFQKNAIITVCNHWAILIQNEFTKLGLIYKHI